MDDSEEVIFPSQEINGNLSQTNCHNTAVDEELSSLSVGFDDIDSSSPRTRSPISGSLNRDESVKQRNDNEDDGYCSQDQHLSALVDSHNLINAQRNQESVRNNNVVSSYARVLDATGKVFSVSMPPNYIVNSNDSRTLFRPNYVNPRAVNTGRDAGVRLEEIPSRRSLDNSDNSRHGPGRLDTAEEPKQERSVASARATDSPYSSASVQRRARASAVNKQACNDEANSSPSRKRKNRGADDNDGDAELASDLVEPDTKRLRGDSALQKQPLQGIPHQYRAPPPAQALSSQYDIRGQANWVVQDAQHCTFHIYQQQGSSQGQVKQHPVEWAGTSIHEVSDSGVKRAFEESSKVVSQAGYWKKLARFLPVSCSPSLEQDLKALEACGGSARDKAMAVLLRWWREECGCSLGDDMKAKLKQGLEACGLIRIARTLDSIIEKSRVK